MRNEALVPVLWEARDVTGRPIPGESPFGRRRFLPAGAAVHGLGLSSSLLTACGDSDQAKAASNAGGELLVWYWGEQEAVGMKRFFEGMVDQYNKAGTDKRAGDRYPVLYAGSDRTIFEGLHSQVALAWVPAT